MAHHDPSSICQSLFSCAAVKSVLNKLVKDVSDELESRSTPFQRDDLAKLKETMSSISTALPDLEQLAINSEVQDLVLDLTEVVYDIEDLLDEAATHRLEKKVLGITDLLLGRINPGQRLMEKNVSGIKGLLPRKKKRPTQDLKSLLVGLDEIAAKLSYSSIIKNKRDAPDPTFVTTTSAALEISSYYNQQLVGSGETSLGREDDKERLIHCILSPSTSLQHPIVINVTGPGGIGKTTMVNVVCNDLRVSSSFDFVSWASYDDSLSYEDGLKKLTREIKASAKGQRDVKSTGISLGALEDGLCSVLQGRKFLLVVDNIKYELQSGWKAYLGLLMVGSKGSTVILISWGSIEIRGLMKTFNLQGMPETECWSLFKRYAAFDDDSEQADSSLKDIGRSIVKKCGGSPLAVKTLASLLHNNKDRHCWEQIHQSKLWGQFSNEAWTAWCINFQRVPVELIPSYIEFTKRIHRDELVWFWMAQGLLQSIKKGDDLRFCNELESMHFLPVDQRGDHLCLLERDFAQCLSRGQRGPVSGYFLPSTRVNLMWTKDMLLAYNFPKDSSTPPPPFKARTFMFLRYCDSGFVIPEGLISNLKRLRVLFLNDFELLELPKSIGNLKLLRYLSLSHWESLRVLPDSICKLVNLQTLDLFGCYALQTLPRNMHQLVSMRHLLLSGTLSSLPNKALKSWTSLHHLIISHCTHLASLEKGIQNLTVLRALQIDNCPSIVSLPNSISCLTTLEELSILNCEKLDLTGWKGLFHLRSLKSLRIQLLPELLELPDGLQSAADSLEHLDIRNCGNLDLTGWNGLLYIRSLKSLWFEGLPKLLKLPDGLQSVADSLEHLAICRCENLDFTGWKGLQNLRSLKSLRIEGLPKLLELPDGLQSAADSLEHLVISNCKNLRRLPESLKHCTCLVEITLSICLNLLALPQGFPALKNLQVLKILKCPNLVQRCRRGTGEDWHLISHIPMIYLDYEVIRNMDTSVQEQPGSLNLSPWKEITPASASSPSEIIPVLEDYSSFQSDYDYHSPNEHHLSSPPSECPAEHPHPVTVEHSHPSCSYGMNIDIQPASNPLPCHPDTDATGSENRGAISNKDLSGRQVLDLEKEMEGKRVLFLFREGYEFHKEMLIQLWMALRILTDEPMEVIGADFFKKLVSEGYILHSVATSMYKVNNEKLDTAELDMITAKQNYVIMDNGNQNDAASTETLHVSVVCDEIDTTAFKTLGRFNRLRTLLFLGNYGSRVQKVPRDLFLCYGSLLALDLSGTHIKELPSSANKMICLRYLDLSWTFIKLLPESIDLFKKLQTLKLKGCFHLHRLPKEMKGLTELRHLDLDVLGQLAAFPEGMGALVNLRTLSAFPVGTGEGLKIRELKHLDNLTGEFCIANLENVQSADEARDALLTVKRSIKMLELRWSDYQLQELKNEDESILENLCPHSNLEEIQILCYPGTSFPGWIADASFQKLVSITLFKCEHVSILPSLGKLPSLNSLKLVGLNSVRKMDCRGELDKVAFPMLQKLAVDEMHSLEVWIEAQEGDYPCLTELRIKDCPKLPELPSLLYLPSLEQLELSGCDNLAFVSEEELSSSLQQLIVEDCPLIKERCSEQGGQDRHKIYHVPNIWIDQEACESYHEDSNFSEEYDDE